MLTEADVATFLRGRGIEPAPELLAAATELGRLGYLQGLWTAHDVAERRLTDLRAESARSRPRAVVYATELRREIDTLIATMTREAAEELLANRTVEYNSACRIHFEIFNDKIGCSQCGRKAAEEPLAR